MNNLTTTGLYYCKGGSSNLPATSGGGGCVVLAQDASIVVQVFLKNNAANDMYTRRLAGGSWTEWKIR